MEFEFGTNWATYSKYVGDIFGSALAAEGIFAFALESGFLGILIFGWNHVGRGMHFFSTIMVFLGSLFSAVKLHVLANNFIVFFVVSFVITTLYTLRYIPHLRIQCLFLREDHEELTDHGTDRHTPCGDLYLVCVLDL